MEDKYKKEMRSLQKFSAPRNFLEQVHARINRFERIKQALFVPAQIKIPLELAAVVTTIIVAFTVYKGIQPTTKVVLEAPDSKLEVLATKRAEKPAAVVKKKAEKPIEIALLIKADEAIMAEMPDKATMGMGAAPRTKAAREEERGDKVLEPSYLNKTLTQIINIIQLENGKVISVEKDKESDLPQYITAEIPAKNYASFLEKLGKLGELQKPLPSKAHRLRIKLVPAK